ncbi:Homeobox-DDT domain protein [Melia azedarach]|uniref:Homeobox-DDT domain protein n=1 Tax=Melia azedarach TaxID=155640 RepID=A0ACC1YN43_MELAZ|nr:Homeobox-DDT domain protein [Melia azedarach]
MEDSGERHSEENKLSLEKNMKRRYKTPAQVMALERFYNEHKYPTEEMKSQLAEQIGLTEKQVSGWFCHRRLKEKRLSADEGFAGGRQDRSSGVIQDRGSGLRQDSCGSTKQGDYRSIDPREVQSRMLYGHDFPAADLAYDHRSQYTTHASGRDDTSSESSSFLRDRLYSQGDEPYAMETSSYIRQNGAITPVNHSSDRSKEYKPSGYLKVKGETENVAISAVKRQLGRHYREDGPPLGVEFDPLPPGAFESRSGDPVNEPFYVGNSRWSRSPDAPEIEKQHTLGSRYEVDDSKTDFQDSYIGEKLNSSNQGYSFSSKHDAGWVGLDSIMNHHDSYCGKIDSEEANRLLHNNPIVSTKLVRNSDYVPKFANFTLGSSKSIDAGERGPSKKKAKVKKLYGERKAIKGHRDPAKVKTHPADEMTVAKRAKVEVPQRDYMAKASYAEIPRWTNQIKGSAADMPSSFSEDETAETSSSVD